MLRETRLAAEDLVLPLFVQEGENRSSPIDSMPGQARLSIDRLVEQAREAERLGVSGVALFPVLSDPAKDSRGSASTQSDGLLQRAVRALKETLPSLLVIKMMQRKSMRAVLLP